MSISFSNILFILLVFQLIFLSVFLFTQEKGKRISNILLGSFFLSIALNLLDVFLLMTGAYAANLWLAGWGSCLPLLFGPFIYFYTQSVLNGDFTISVKSWIHFLPFIIFFLTTEIYYITQPAALREKLLSNLLQHHIPGPVSIVSTLIFIQFLGYILTSFRLISKYKKAANQQFSSSQQTDISWLSNMILFFLMIIVVTILNGLFAQTSLAPYYLLVFNIIILATLAFVISVLMKALQKPYFFSFSKEDTDAANPSSASQNIPPDSVKTEKEELAKKILDYMKTNKPYLEPELTLEELASRLSLRPRILSQTINETLGQNFYDFINRFRIKEATNLLTNPKDEKVTVLEILYEVGFNSKSSFNTLFKKYTGLTPKEFRKKQRD